MSSKTKKKEEEVVSEGRSPAIPRSQPGGEQAVEDSWLAFWEDAVNDLQTKNFSSYAEALDAVVEQITQRMPVSEDEARETGVFIKQLFDLDPILQEELKSVFGVQ